MLSLAQEIRIAIEENKGLSSLGEVADAINRMRIEKDYRLSNRLFAQVKTKVQEIRREPKKYGFSIGYKNSSRYTYYVIIPFDKEDILDLTDERRKYLKVGISKQLKVLRRQHKNGSYMCNGIIEYMERLPEELRQLHAIKTMEENIVNQIEMFLERLAI